MTVSRDTHDPAKNYHSVVFHEDRTLLDSELNEQQAIALLQIKRVADALFREGAILNGLEVAKDENVLEVSAGTVYVNGAVEAVDAATLTYDADKDSGADYVYVEVLVYRYTATLDEVLVNPYTNEPTAERDKWVATLKAVDTTADELPENAVSRKVVAIYKFDRATNEVLPTVQQKSNINLEDFGGSIPGQRITVGSVTENQLALEAAEGLQSILQNMAERTHDQSGNYLVNGLDSFVGDVDGDGVRVITNAGRAYVKGYRFNRDLPTITHVPRSTAVREVRGEQKTYQSTARRFTLNSVPLKETTQVEAVVETTASVTRGNVAGGEDVLSPTPVVTILSVTQGETTFEKDVDWQQAGNSVDWLGANEPLAGTTYTVTFTYTRQMEKGTDYADGSWFGQTGYPAADTEYFYLVTAVTGNGESQYNTGFVVSRLTAAGEINRLTWTSVPGATSYRVYRGTANTGRTDFTRIKTGLTTNVYDDDGVDEAVSANPPATNTSGVVMSSIAIAAGNNSCVNFGGPAQGIKPVNGSNASVDYEYYLGRRDIIACTSSDIIRVEGVASDTPKDPVVPDTALRLCSVLCPPNSPALTVRNFRLRRITMDQINRLREDVEALKYNDARSQMNAILLNRTAESKKGVYSDDFSNDVQSDPYHGSWAARIDNVQRFVAPPRQSSNALLAVDTQDSTARFATDIATLPATEITLVEQLDWSEASNVNPWGTYDVPPAVIKASPTMGRRGQTTVGVTGDFFARSASNLTVRCDGQIVVQNVTTDTFGRFSTTFLVPADATLGQRIVSVTDGSRTAEVLLEVQGEVETARIATVTDEGIVRRVTIADIWRRWAVPTRIDPLAQTFNFTEGKVVSAVGLYFTTKDTTKPVLVQVRGVNSGVPNSTVYAERVLLPTEVTLNAETKVTFPNPIYCEPNVSYAIVVLTDSDSYRLRVAMLGAIGQNGIITRQTYAAGVMLTSSNAETWAPRPGADLTMKIYGLQFAGTGTIAFAPTITLSLNAFNLDEFSSIPEGCTITWQWSWDEVDWRDFTPGEDEPVLDTLTTYSIRALLSSPRSNESPTLLFKNTNLIGYKNATAGTYVTRELVTTQTIDSTVVYAEMNIPSGTTVTWHASNDGGESWVEMEVDGTQAVSQEWTEYTLTAEFPEGGNRIRYKAVFAISDAAVYPRVHRLGTTLS